MHKPNPKIKSEPWHCQLPFKLVGSCILVPIMLLDPTSITSSWFSDPTDTIKKQLLSPVGQAIPNKLVCNLSPIVAYNRVTHTHTHTGIMSTTPHPSIFWFRPGTKELSALGRCSFSFCNPTATDSHSVVYGQRMHINMLVFTAQSFSDSCQKSLIFLDCHCDKKLSGRPHNPPSLYCKMRIVAGYSACCWGLHSQVHFFGLWAWAAWLCVNWHDPSSSEMHQTIPEGAALAMGKGHIYPRLSPLSSPKAQTQWKVYSSLLGLIIPPLRTGSQCFSAALCLIENTFPSSTLLPCWQ